VLDEVAARLLGVGQHEARAEERDALGGARNVSVIDVARAASCST